MLTRFFKKKLTRQCVITRLCLVFTSHLSQTAETDRLVIRSQDQSRVRDEKLERSDISGGSEDPATARQTLHSPREAVTRHLSVGVKLQMSLTHSKSAVRTPALCVRPANDTGHPPVLSSHLHCTLSTGYYPGDSLSLSFLLLLLLLSLASRQHTNISN